MHTDEFKIAIGDLGVKTTQNRGHTPEEVAEMATDKIISISDNADPMVQAQARAYKDAIENVVLLYMKQAIVSDRSTVAGLLDKQGHEEMAKIIRRL